MQAELQAPLACTSRASALAGAALPSSTLGSSSTLATVALRTSSTVLLVHHLHRGRRLQVSSDGDSAETAGLLGLRMLRVLLGAIHSIGHDHGSAIRSHLHAHVLLHVALLRRVHAVGMAMSLYLLALAHGVALHSIGHGGMIWRLAWGGHALWVHSHLVRVLQHLRGKMASLHPKASTLPQVSSSLRELELLPTRATANRSLEDSLTLTRLRVCVWLCVCLHVHVRVCECVDVDV